MKTNDKLRELNETLSEFPEEAWQEVLDFVSSLKSKYRKKKTPKTVKLGGLLAQFKLDITEEDIAEARREMWGKLGKLEG